MGEVDGYSVVLLAAVSATGKFLICFDVGTPDRRGMRESTGIRFNYRLSGARRIVECAWDALEPILTSPKTYSTKPETGVLCCIRTMIALLFYYTIKLHYYTISRSVGGKAAIFRGKLKDQKWRQESDAGEDARFLRELLKS